MQTQLLRKPYKGTDTEMRSIGKTMWTQCALYQALFAAVSPDITTVYINARLAAIVAAANLPDFQARVQLRKDLRDFMEVDSVEILRIYRLMVYYATNAITVPSQLANAINAMGKAYVKGVEDFDWESCESILLSLNLFATNNATLLSTSGNMPASYLTELATITTTFTDHYADFKTEDAAVLVATQTRRLAHNAIYTDLKRMFKLSRLLPLTPAARKEFNYAYQYRAISGALAGTKGHIYSAATLAPIAFARIEFTDIGVVVYTDADGAFIIHAASGSHDVNITAPNPSVGPAYMPYNDTVFVTAFTVSTRDFYLLQ